MYLTESTFWMLDQTRTRTYDAGIFFERLASLALLICLVELGISFLFCSSGAYPSHNIMRWTAVGLSAILVALAIASITEIETFLTEYYNEINNAINSDTSSIDHSKWTTSTKLCISFDIIEWGAAILIVVLGSFVMHKSRAKNSLHSVSAVGSSFFFLR
jgi:hypothetical protein